MSLALLLEDARDEGEAWGEAKRSRDIAVSMLQHGLSPEMIATCTGLTLSEVQQLQQQQS